MAKINGMKVGLSIIFIIAGIFLLQQAFATPCQVTQEIDIPGVGTQTIDFPQLVCFVGGDFMATILFLLGSVFITGGGWALIKNVT